MAFIKDDDIKVIQERFAPLTGLVTLKYFESKENCEYCPDTRQMLEELTNLSDKLNLEIYDLDSDEAKKYEITKAPAIVPIDEKDNDFGMKFYGIPAGYEFSTLLETIELISKGSLELNDELDKKISQIDFAVDLQVFVTPTCPYCPQGVLTAFALAYKNKNITASMVEATEFPELSKKYGVMGVPRTVINDDEASLEGAAPMPMVLDKILELR